MCIYNKLVLNRKYTENQKNRGIIPPITDIRTKWIAAGCGNCMECRKQKAREWQIRLVEDIKKNTEAKFITLTFSDKSIAELAEDVNNWVLRDGRRIKHKRNLQGYILDNEIAIRAMRLFNERWRKEYGVAIRHWMITEIGHKGTQNIHMHGIVWVKGDREEAYKNVERIWKFGTIWPRTARERKTTYVNDRTIGYMTKYVSKIDVMHKTYKPKILTSAGIGANYISSVNARKNIYIPGKTDEAYRTSTGHKVALPIYWRNKIYTEEQREKLWIEKLDKEIRWVCGEKIDISQGTEEYIETVRWYRKKNRKLGYGDDEKNYAQEEYERQQRILMQKTRIAKGKTTISTSKTN